MAIVPTGRTTGRLATLLLLASCVIPPRVTAPPAPAPPAPVGSAGGPLTTIPNSMVPTAVRDYLDSLLETTEENYWNSDAVDWPTIRTRLFALADGAGIPAEAYPAIRVTLNQIDRHAFLQTPEEAQESGDEDPFPVLVELVEPNLGLVAVPRYSGPAGPIADEWAGAAHQAITALPLELCGWVVDLRDNPGGNMWPMLAAVGPLLDGDLVGGFSAPDGTVTPWRYEDGVAYEGAIPIVRVDRPLPSLGAVPVAVLIGSRTASSGEAIAVAFKTRRQTLFLGEATSGLTTANAPFELTDGAVLNLPVSLFTDRSGYIYPGNTPILPDEETPPARIMNAAIDWLWEQSTCR